MDLEDHANSQLNGTCSGVLLTQTTFITRVNVDADIITFPGLDPTEFEQGPCELARTYDEARLIFLQGKEWIEKGRQFYELDGHVSEYVATVQVRHNV